MSDWDGFEVELRASLAEAFGRLVYFQGHSTESDRIIDAAVGAVLKLGDSWVTEVMAARDGRVDDERVVTAEAVASEAVDRLRALALRHRNDQVATEILAWLDGAAAG